MSEPGKGPKGQRRGRGARERILDAAQVLFRQQGINTTGMDQLCAAAQVSKRTAYQHFGSKDALVAAYLRRIEDVTLDAAFDRPDLTPRERLLAVFERPLASPPGDAAPGTTSTPEDGCCPFVGAAVEIADPEHPARVLARGYKQTVTARLTEIAREAGATDPELLGEQLALLLDGASARTRILGADALPTAVGVAATLIASAVPGEGSSASRPAAGGTVLPQSSKIPAGSS